MADLEDLIQRVNRDMEEHRRQMEASQLAMAEQRRLTAERAAWFGYFLLPLALAAVVGIVLWGPLRSS
jgi:hypothetical protein